MRAVRTTCLLAVLAVCLLFAAGAHADAIAFEVVAVAGIAILIPLLAFVVFVESIFLAFGLRVSYRRVLYLALAANVVSLLAGIPVKIVNAWMYGQILPRPLPAYFEMYPRAVLLGTALYFGVTLITEFIVVAWWRRRQALGGNLARVAFFVFIANAATYSVLAPANYFWTRPTDDVRQFTDDSGWAQTPTETVLFIDPSGQLCSIRSNGQDKQVIVPDVVRDFQYLPDQGIVLYRNGTDALCIWRESEKKSQVCLKSVDPGCRMSQCACSPDGKLVAHLNESTLVLSNVENGQETANEMECGWDAEIAWSNEPRVLLLKNANQVVSCAIDDNMKITQQEPVVEPASLPRVYGRFSNYGVRTPEGWVGSLNYDTAGGMEARTFFGLESHLTVNTDTGKLRLADNPGLLKLARRSFNDVAFLDNGKELVFDASGEIYLLDVAQRRVGRITPGSRLIMVSARCQRDIWREE